MPAPAVGIDLGTTYSCVAVLQGGGVDIIRNDMGNNTTPSYVAFTETQRLVGEAAKIQAHRNGKNTLYDAKRLIGRKYSDPCVQDDMKLWSFFVREGNGDKPVLQVEHEKTKKTFAPQEVSAMVLSRLKKFAEDYLDDQVTQAVVTVPAYFNDAQRAATIEAGRIAGLEVLRIISEPVAAALTYGLQQQRTGGAGGGKKKVLIYDLGGGTCDVSILEIDGGDFNVLAKDGDMHLGGEDFDRCIVDHFMREINRKHRVDLSKNERARRRLHSAAEHAKRTLSTSDCADVELEGLVEGDDFFTKLTCAKFEDLCEEHFQRCMKPVSSCLEAAGLSVGQIDEVVLVGGSTRVPRIQSLLQMHFNGKTLNKSVNPDEAVAYGAAIQAAMLTGRCSVGVKSLQDVSPLSLGIDCYGDVFSVVIPRNTRIPTSVTKTNYENARDFQPTTSFPVYEGERKVSSQNHLLGEFAVSHPKGKKGTQKFSVTFAIDSNGILTVTATHRGTNNTMGITINHHSGRHTEEEVRAMVEAGERYRRADEETLKKQKAKNLLEEYMFGVNNALRAGLGSHLDPRDASDLRAAVQRAELWLENCGEGLREAYEYESQRDRLETICIRALRNALAQRPRMTISREVLIAAGRGPSATILAVTTRNVL